MYFLSVAKQRSYFYRF